MIEVSHHLINQLAAAWIDGVSALRKKAEQIACFLGCLGSISGWCRREHVFKCRLSRAQRFLIGLDLRSQTSQVRRLLSCHPAMGIEIRRSINHSLIPPLPFSAHPRVGRSLRRVRSAAVPASWLASQ
jgi:hypothetical protein